MLKKIVLLLVLSMATVLLLVQLSRPEFTNPAVAAGMEIDRNPIFSPEVRMIVKNSCADCHSNETIYPWYAKITPVNW